MKKFKLLLKSIFADLKNKIPPNYEYFISVAFWSSLLIFFDSALGFIFGIFLIKLLNPVLLGKWYWVLSIVSLLSLFLFSGNKMVLAKDMINNKFSSFFKSLKLRLYGSFFITFIILIISFYLYYRKKDYLILLSLIFYFPLSAYSIYFRYLYVKDYFKEMFYLSFIKMLVYYGISILFLFLNFDLIFIILSYFYFQVLVDLLAYLYYKPKILKDVKTYISENKNFYKSTIQMSLIYFLPVFVVNFDKVIFPLFFSLKELGIISVIFFIPISIKNILYRLYVPIFFKKFNFLKDDKKFILKSSFYLFLLVSFSILFLILILPFVYNFLFSEIYFQYLYYINLILLFLVFDIIADYFRSYFESTIKLKELFKIQIFSSLFYFSIFFTFIYFQGFIGIVLARIGYMIFNFCINLYYIKLI